MFFFPKIALAIVVFYFKYRGEMLSCSMLIWGQKLVNIYIYIFFWLFVGGGFSGS